MTTGTLNKPQTAEKTNEKTRALTMSDRCDKCNAQAFVYAYKIVDSENFMELFFCGHHGYRFMTDLQTQGFLVEDSRDLINAKNESSS